LLKQQWGLDLDHDLRNPQLPHAAPAALFQRARPNKPVVFKPLIALGMENPTHGGWYAGGPDAGDLPVPSEGLWRELWSYAYKQPASEQQSGKYTPPPIASGSVEFEPGDEPAHAPARKAALQGDDLPVLRPRQQSRRPG